MQVWALPLTLLKTHSWDPEGCSLLLSSNLMWDVHCLTLPLT